MPIDTSLDSLRPAFRNLAVVWLHIVRDDLGLNVKVMETLRTKARQNEVLAAGSSKVSFGFHNVGLAFDFACFSDNGVYITNGDDRRYEQCGQIGEALGCVWGGRWHMRDSGHIEFHPNGKTLAQIVADEGLTT